MPAELDWKRGTLLFDAQDLERWTSSHPKAQPPVSETRAERAFPCFAIDTPEGSVYLSAVEVSRLIEPS